MPDAQKKPARSVIVGSAPTHALENVNLLADKPIVKPCIAGRWMYPHPPLVFMIRGRELFVRALAENRRPNSNTRLKIAPY